MSVISSPLIQNGTAEQRVLIMLSMVRGGASNDQLESLLNSRLNWPWIIMQAMHHRTICILWHNLKSKDLVLAACRSGLGKNWIAYCEQLMRASIKKNKLWLKILRSTIDELKKKM